MQTKLYVGNLPYQTDEEELRSLFQNAGIPEDVTVVMDRETGRSRGFGFVTMSSAEDAQKAIETWNGQEYEGRKLIVNEARPKESRESRGDNFGPSKRKFGDGGGKGKGYRPRRD